MKLILQSAFRYPAIRRLIYFCIFTILLMTIANSLEIITIGFVTKRGTDMSGGLLDRMADTFNTYIPYRDNLWVLGCLILFTTMFKASMLFIHRFTARKASIKLAQNLRYDYFRHIQKLPMSFYQSHNIGSLSSRVVGDAGMISDAMQASLVNYVATPLAVISSLAMCLITSWKLSLLIFVGFPLILFPIAFLAKRVKKVSREIQNNQDKFSSVLIDFVGGIQTVKVFAMEKFSLKKYAQFNDRMADLERKSAKYDLSTRPIVHTLAMIFLILALVYGLYFLEMPISDVLIFCGFLYLFYEPIKKFAEENSHIQRGVSAAERMLEVIEIKPDSMQEEGQTPFTGFNHDIEFKNVSFKYDQEPILSNISFKIKKGEMVALVGPTGAGKSTLVQLIPRLYDVTDGAILFDGHNIVDYNQKTLRERIAFVPQKPFLFLDTIAENIKFGEPFTHEEVLEASKLAHAHEFVDKLPQKYETLLSEGGKNLSGGQQQRLTIARALIKKAPLLIMDEATASLDALSEHYIKETIQFLKGETTQIIIAHRLSTIENADKIVYMERGLIIDMGTKDELLSRCAGFKRLWDLMKLSN